MAMSYYSTHSQLPTCPMLWMDVPSHQTMSEWMDKGAGCERAFQIPSLRQLLDSIQCQDSVSTLLPPPSFSKDRFDSFRTLPGMSWESISMKSPCTSSFAAQSPSRTSNYRESLVENKNTNSSVSVVTKSNSFANAATFSNSAQKQECKPSVGRKRRRAAAEVSEELAAQSSPSDPSTPPNEEASHDEKMLWITRRRPEIIRRRNESSDGTSPAAHLRFVIRELSASLPADGKRKLLPLVRAYTSGELTPAEMAEAIKAIVDEHAVVVRLHHGNECDTRQEPSPRMFGRRGTHAVAAAAAASAAAASAAELSPSARGHAVGGVSGAVRLLLGLRA